MKKTDYILVAIIVAATATAGGLYLRRPGPFDHSVMGKTLPRGLVTEDTQVVAVLTPTCPYCVASVNSWNKLLQDGVKIVGVSARHDREAIDAFKRETGAAFPIIITDDGEWANRLGMNVVPYTLTVAADGRIRHAYRGWLHAPDVILEALGK